MSTSNVLATVLSISYCLFNPESLNYHHSIGMKTRFRSSALWNPAKLGGWCWRLPPSLLPAPIIFLCGFKKPFGNRPFLGQIKSFGLYLNLPISIDGEILGWKFPRVFPSVWFYQDHYFQAKWFNWCLLIQVSLWGHLCEGSRETVGEHTLSQKRVLPSTLPKSAFSVRSWVLSEVPAPLPSDDEDGNVSLTLTFLVPISVILKLFIEMK